MTAEALVTDVMEKARAALGALRPRLRQDAAFLPTADGLLVRSGEKTFLLKGRSIYRWMSALAPRLDGERTLDELCAPMPPERAALVARIVSTLVEKGVAKDHQPEPEVALAEAVRERFASTIAFIDHHADAPRARFQRWRTARVVMMGGGESFKAAALSLLRNGLEALVLAPIAGAATEVSEIEAAAAALDGSGVRASVSMARASALDELGRAGPGLLLYCADRARLREVDELQRRCRRDGWPLLVGLLLGDQSVVGPLAHPDGAGCWRCGLLRLAANMEGARSAALWRALALDEEAPVDDGLRFAITARLLGNTVAFEAFKALSGTVPPESEGGLLLQDLETLETRRAPMIAHPLCDVCSDVDAEAATLRLRQIVCGERDVAAGMDEPLERLVASNDRRTGLFQGFDDDRLAQLPLRATRLAMACPRGSGPLAVPGYSLETSAHARVQAAIEGLTRYAAACTDPRRVVWGSVDDLRALGGAPVAPEALSSWGGGAVLGRDDAIEWLPAWAAFEGRVRHVPAAAVYRLSPFNALGRFARGREGWAVGTTFAALCRTAVSALLAREIVDDAQRGRAGAAWLDVAALAAGDRDLAYLVTTAARFGGRWEAIELRNGGPVCVCVVRDPDAASDEEPVAAGWGLSRAAAARDALVEWIAALQVGAVDEARRVVLPPDLPIGETPLTAASSADAEEVDACLRRAGRERLFVDGTPEDVRAATRLIAGAVLLTARTEERQNERR